MPYEIIYSKAFPQNPDLTGKTYYSGDTGYFPSVYSFASGYNPYREAAEFNANMIASGNNLLKWVDPATVAAVKGKQNRFENYQERQAINDVERQNLVRFYAGEDYDPELLPDYRWAFPNGVNMTIEDALIQYENIDPKTVKVMSVAPGSPVKSDAGRFFGNAQYQIGKFLNDEVFLNEGGTRTANWNIDRTRTGLERQREANDFVANVVLSAATAPWMLSNAATLGALIAAGEWGTIASALAGGYVGHEFVNDVSQKLTGKTIEEHLQNNGINAYNSAILHPGSIGGSYAGSKLYSGITNNGFAWLYNNNTVGNPIVGPQGTVQVPVGTTYNLPHATNSTIGYGRNIGVKHRGAYGNHKVSSGGLVSHTGKSTSWGYKPEVTLVKGSNGGVDVYANPFEPYLPTQSVVFPLGTVIQTPPEQPPVVPPLLPEVRHVETSPTVTPWEQWFAEQPEGTVQWFYGIDPNHRPGPYLIKRSGNFWHKKTRVGQHEGYVAPDSTKIEVVTTPPEYEVIRKQGAVDPAATIDYNQRINIEDAR